MTDSSGQLIVHPRIDDDYIKVRVSLAQGNENNNCVSCVTQNNLFLDDFVSFDISYFEHAHNMTRLELLKSAMVNREEGSITIPIWIPIEKEVHVHTFCTCTYITSITCTLLYVFHKSRNFCTPQKRYLLRNITYHYAPVDNTPFRYTCQQSAQQCDVK